MGAAERHGRRPSRITVEGGKIKSRRGKEEGDISERYTGRTTKPYIVKPNADTKQVVITAFIHGDGDAILVNLEHQKVPPPPPPVEHRIVNEIVDVILCSGRNCSEEPGVRDRVSKGDAQLLRWEAGQGKTRSLGFQLSLPETTVRKVFCKSPNELTANEFAHAVRDAKILRFVSNSEQKRYFDLDDAWFVYGPSGRFSFVNNYEDEPNHHFRNGAHFDHEKCVCIVSFIEQVAAPFHAGQSAIATAYCVECGD